MFARRRFAPRPRRVGIQSGCRRKGEDRMKSRIRSRSAARTAGLLSVAAAANAWAVPASVSIGNGTQLPDGSYIRAQNIANNLTFTSVTVQATNNIDIVDNIDLATSPLGTPLANLSLQALTFNLNHNMNMSAFGGLFLNANTNTVNMIGKITSGA